MKSLLICTALLFTFSLCGNKDNGKDDTSGVKPIAGSGKVAENPINKSATFDLAVNAKNGQGYAMTWTVDSILTVNDSLTTIMGLIKGVKQLQAQQASYLEQNQRVAAEAQIAREIFRYINTDGTVSDRKRFEELVKSYQNLLPK
jgi:hypothetical protein